MSRDIVKEFESLNIEFSIVDMMVTPSEWRVEFRVRDEDFDVAFDWADEFEHSYYTVSISPGLLK